MEHSSQCDAQMIKVEKIYEVSFVVLPELQRNV
jgi:hypothetical protein